jgi:type IV secretion system protein TrbL
MTPVWAVAGGDCSNPIYFATHASSCVAQGASEIVSAAANDSLKELMNRTLEGFGAAVASMGSMWVQVPTPVLTAGDGSTTGGGTPPGSEAFGTILNYVTYIGLTVAVLSLIALGALITVRVRRGEGVRSVGALGIIFFAVMLISGASALVGGLLSSSAPEGSSSAVGFLQNSLWFYVGGLAVLSVILGGIRMAWEQRAQPGKDLIQSLLTLLAVSGAGLAILTLAVTAADAFSVWVLNNATDCDVSVGGASQCFGTNVAAMLALSASSPIGVIGVLVLAAIAMLMVFVQVALMVVRAGLLVILAGVLPLTASFTNTQMGRQWFGRVVGWTLAFVLYKPTAAIIYAAAFQLVGTDAFQDDGGGLWSILTGMALMLMALVALPALLRFVAPMTSAVAGGGGAGMAMAGAAGAIGGDVATGAVRRMSSSAGSAGGGGAAPSSGVGSAATGAGGGAGPRPVAAVGSGGGASGAAAGGGKAAAGAASSGGAAAGPAGAAVLVTAAGVKAGKGSAAATKQAARTATDDSTNGPSGSQ